MSVLSTGLAKTSAGGYDIDNSLRFNDDDSANLTWLQGTSNRRTWTWSGWVKRGNLTNEQPIITWQNNSENSDWDTLEFSTTDTIRYYMSGAISAFFVTNQVFRDTSAWYHICLAVDTTQATASNRVKLYVNGEQVTSFSTATYPSQNYDTWTNLSGRYAALGSNIYADTTFTKYLDGYLAEVNFVDGQALTPADFGETDETYGHWKPIAYTGTYGTNGFYLDFKNSGSLGNDANGSNNWTPNNLAATDQMLDSPTNNFCTWNPLINSSGTITYSEGSLKTAPDAYWGGALGSQSVTTGKWYWENSEFSSTNVWIGITVDDVDVGVDVVQSENGVISYKASGESRTDGSSTASWGASYSTTDIVGVALDLDGSTVKFYKNNSLQGTISLTSNFTNKGVTPLCSAYSQNQIANFGQDSSFAGNKTAQGNQDSNDIGDFYYEPPTDFLALCTSNLPAVAVTPSEHFNTVLYTGTGSTLNVTGVGFQPDFTWLKRRDSSAWHQLFDAVRGTGIGFYSNESNAESDNGSLTLASFDSDGFTVGASGGINTSSATMVGWNWKAGTSVSGTTTGAGTGKAYSGSVNVDAGFSIITYKGNATDNHTVPHHLGVVPEIIMLKNRDAGEGWVVYTEPTGNTGFLGLNSTGAFADSDGEWSDVSPTSSVFNLGTQDRVNTDDADYMAYSWTSVDGYSKVGSYVGNGSTDGTFVYTGFTPAYVMIKQSSASGENWYLFDNERSTYNAIDDALKADESVAETTNTSKAVDFTSNGFKCRGSNGALNGSGATYIYLAFAEQPFKHTNAR